MEIVTDTYWDYLSNATKHFHRCPECGSTYRCHWQHCSEYRERFCNPCEDKIDKDESRRANLALALRDENIELKRRLRANPDCPVDEKLLAERRISENEEIIATLETGV